MQVYGLAHRSKVQSIPEGGDHESPEAEGRHALSNLSAMSINPCRIFLAPAQIVDPLSNAEVVPIRPVCWMSAVSGDFFHRRNQGAPAVKEFVDV